MARQHQSKAYKENKKGPFLEAFRQIGTVSGASDLVRISRSQVYEWQKNDPAFADAFEKAEKDLTEKLESVAVEKALKGDNNLIQFLLKARAPEKYTERYKHEIESRQFAQIIGLMTGVIKRVVPQMLWPRVATELEAAANSLQLGKGNFQIQ